MNGKRTEWQNSISTLGAETSTRARRRLFVVNIGGFGNQEPTMAGVGRAVRQLVTAVCRSTPVVTVIVQGVSLVRCHATGADVEVQAEFGAVHGHCMNLLAHSLDMYMATLSVNVTPRNPIMDTIAETPPTLLLANRFFQMGGNANGLATKDEQDAALLVMSLWLCILADPTKFFLKKHFGSQAMRKSAASHLVQTLEFVAFHHCTSVSVSQLLSTESMSEDAHVRLMENGLLPFGTAFSLGDLVVAGEDDDAGDLAQGMFELFSSLGRELLQQQATNRQTVVNLDISEIMTAAAAAEQPLPDLSTLNIAASGLIPIEQPSSFSSTMAGAADDDMWNGLWDPQQQPDDVNRRFVAISSPVHNVPQLQHDAGAVIKRGRHCSVDQLFGFDTSCKIAESMKPTMTGISSKRDDEGRRNVGRPGRQIADDAKVKLVNAGLFPATQEFLTASDDDKLSIVHSIVSEMDLACVWNLCRAKKHPQRMSSDDFIDWLSTDPTLAAKCPVMTQRIGYLVNYINASVDLASRSQQCRSAGPVRPRRNRSKSLHFAKEKSIRRGRPVKCFSQPMAMTASPSFSLLGAEGEEEWEYY